MVRNTAAFPELRGQANGDIARNVGYRRHFVRSMIAIASRNSSCAHFSDAALKRGFVNTP